MAHWFAPNAIEAWFGASVGKRREFVREIARKTATKLASLRNEKHEEKRAMCRLVHVFPLVSASKIMLVSPEYAAADHCAPP